MSYQFGNNVNVDITGIGTEVIFHKEAGTSTESDIYLNIPDRLIRKIAIANDKAFVIVAINGEEFTNPKTVSAAKGFALECTYFDGLESVKIRTADTPTHIEVMMW